MKTKTLLLALACAGTLSAQNVLLNPGFNEPFTAFTYNGQEWSCPEFIEGWDMTDEYAAGNYSTGNFNNVGLSQWNIRAEILNSEEYEEDWITEDEVQYLRLQRFEQNGWYDGGLYQTINMTPGVPYTLSFYYRVSPGTIDGDWVSPLQPNIRILEWTSDRKGAVVWQSDVLESPDAFTWTKFEETITLDASSSGQYHFYIYFNNSDTYEQSYDVNNGVYAEYDQFYLAPQGSGIKGNEIVPFDLLKTGEGVEVCGIESGAEIAMYDMTGVQVYSAVADGASHLIPAVGQGVYVVKVGKAAQKIVF